ncbi:MAG TPA: proprotein convertase P-domain-containing protein [Sandaracinaceae bacterium LLY-WYZ-13_1]|nr:proprotein convertase P-domain-containing protein [Sandaracinaceae bacterium LLY-WYZ-13_1]
MTRTQLIATTLGALLALAGCAPTAPVDPSDKDEEPTTLGGKEDRWNSRNDPERFDGEFNYHVEDLPLEGTAEHEAWPSTYWPTYEDSINARWNGDDLSPAQKYDMAFNGWTPPAGFDELRPFSRRSPVPEEDWDPSYYEQQGPLASHVSRNMGNRRDREAAIDASGQPEGDWDVETWWGLCHAWVPAAMLEDRPLRPVTYNGVTFEVGDMEALLIAAYNRTPADMIGGRCNAGGGDTEVERDEHGRPIDVDCRDSNPGSLHVIVTNYLGIEHDLFAMDRTFDYEVWNQPVVGYEITQQREVTVPEANELLSREGDSYELNEDAAQLFEVRMSLRWITESHASTTPNDAARHTRTDRLHYILEVDEEGKVIGGEWISSSYPDFLWNPRRLERSSVPYLDLDDVRMLVQMSREPEMPEPTDGALVADGEGGIAIPDNQAEGIASTATVDGSGVVTTVAVDLDISHTYIGDLQVVLEHGGVERTLHNREGGSEDDLVRTFEAVGFEGLDPSGEWTLRVSDHAGYDEGTLNSWRVTVGVEDGTPVDPPPSTDGTRFEATPGAAIPDDDSAGISSTLEVEGATEGELVTIEVGITHTYIGDLLIEVEAPNGERFVLHEREGGGDDDLEATYPLDETGRAYEDSADGTWTLHVSDNAGIDTGTLDRWAVVVGG